MKTGKEPEIVVVDDDLTTLELVRRLFRNSEYEVRYFANELEAIDFLQRHRVEVLIVDFRMPRVDGIKLLQCLADGGSLYPEHVFLCSSVDVPADVRTQAGSAGARLMSKDIFHDKCSFLDLIHGCVRHAALSH